MLQISTGKLFQRNVGHRNYLRGVIYTNLRFDQVSIVDTKAGSLLPTSNLRGSNVVIYELEEQIESEKQENQPALLLSHGVDPYILDFSAIISFVLNCTASPNHALTDRLVSDEISVSTFSTPKKIVKRVFDKEIYCTEDDKSYLIAFIEQLMGLERKTYLGVMRAIRTYVTGMHRIADDFELAYTLLVASLESLAQDFDGHKPSWSDYDERKKKAIDLALLKASDEVSKEVRDALLSIEYTALGRRFRDFSLKHVKPSFYREEVADVVNPITRTDLPKALKTAYESRSQYIHNLEVLPKQLTFIGAHSDTHRIGNRTFLTIEGLSRLARHVITEFIMQQPIIEHESYDYLYEVSGVTSVGIDPKYWIGHPVIDSNLGNKRLEGFLSQLASCMIGIDNASITDLTNVLSKLEKNIDKLKKEDKLSFIALYLIFNGLIHENDKMNNTDNFIVEFRKELDLPTSQALFFNLLLKITPNWDIEKHSDCLKKYFKERDYKLKFRAPKVFEAGLILQLAERYRLDNEYIKAKDLIAMAVENYPENVELRQFEVSFELNIQPIEWSDILLSEQSIIKVI